MQLGNTRRLQVVYNTRFGELWEDRGEIEDEDSLMQRREEYKAELPEGVLVLTCGGHYAQDVRQQCRNRLSKKVFAIAGSNKHDAPYTGPPRKQKIVINKRLVGACWRYDIGVDAGKQMIMDNLRVQKPGVKYCHFPKRDDYGSAYFKGLLSEHLVHDEKKKQPWQWKKIPGHERNESLDLRNYAMAAFKVLPADLDAIDRRLMVARKKTPVASVAAPAMSRTTKRPAQRKGSALDRFYDEW